MTRDKRQDSEIEIERVKLRADKEPSPFTVKFTSDEQTAAFQYLGSCKAAPAQPDSQVDLALFAIVQFLEEGQRAGAGGGNQSILQK